ncbi:MAG: hypothetical protein Q4D60_09870 [Eubacteriales bacterium]|nr:hypothetical protein [Eubacteriales bacterium]
MELGDNIKKLLLAGIGTAAVTAEKSKEILDELVRKGELTVEQGKALNQELKHSMKECVDHVASFGDKDTKKDAEEDIFDMLNRLSPEQVAALKEEIEAMEEKNCCTSPEAEDEAVTE